MTATHEHSAKEKTAKAQNLRVAFICLAVVGSMSALVAVSVPLYSLFCQYTGYGGTTRRASLGDDIKVIDRKMTVRFDANTAYGLDWQFEPVERSVEMKIGERVKIHYTAQNLSNKVLTGTATFNVTPARAGAWFNKIECFCFTETTLKPGEKIDMPVVFFIDPEIANEKELANINTITLSYTMFEASGNNPPPPGSTATGEQSNMIKGKVSEDKAEPLRTTALLPLGMPISNGGKSRGGGGNGEALNSQLHNATR